MSLSLIDFYIAMFCELLNLGLIKIQGKDASKFLQGQLTCDVMSIHENQGIMGAHCNPQGRIISLFYLFLYQDAYYLLMQKTMIPIAIHALKKYAVFYKVELSDANEEGLLPLGLIDDNAIATTPKLVRIPLSTNLSIILGPIQNIHEIPKKSRQLTLAEWDYLMIQQNIPVIYPPSSGKFLPHDINLHQLNAISFNKGCYTGQEIIARMHYKAKLKKRMMKVMIENRGSENIQPGLDVTHGQISGMVVNACYFENKYHVLMIGNQRENDD